LPYQSSQDADKRAAENQTTRSFVPGEDQREANGDQEHQNRNGSPTDLLLKFSVTGRVSTTSFGLILCEICGSLIKLVSFTLFNFQTPHHSLRKLHLRELLMQTHEHVVCGQPCIRVAGLTSNLMEDSRLKIYGEFEFRIAKLTSIGCPAEQFADFRRC
jgi:hypothetical protein